MASGDASRGRAWLHPSATRHSPLAHQSELSVTSPAHRLGLGTVQFGLAYGVSNTSGQVPVEEARAILALAREAGIGTLDTAAAYGTSEERLGEALDTAARFRIVTKTLRLAEGLDKVIARARRSVELIGRQPLDALLVHSAGDLAGGEGERLWRAMQGLKAEGLYARIGISAYAADGPLEVARRFGPEIMQLPVSLLDQRLVANGTLSGLAEQGVEVHARSVFLQGLALMEPAAVPQKLASARPHIERLRRSLADAGSTPLSAALHFVLQQPEIGVALVGVTSHGELAQILAAVGTAPPTLDWAASAISDERILTPSLW